MFDTDISSYIMKGTNAAVIKRLQRVAVEDVCISAIVRSELAFGVEISPRHMQDLARFETFLKYMEVLDYPSDTAVHYGEIRADLQQRGRMIVSNDLLIAAHAR
jgi:tRNA(fMet)-specific endonuclease VapC